MTTITVLGATGRVGTLVCREALRRGLSVRALVRSPARLADDLAGAPSLTAVVGEVDDVDAVARALASADAVVATVGLRYRRGHPWSAVDGRADVVPVAVATLVEAVASSTVPPHVVLLSAFGAGDSWRSLPAVARLVVRTSSLRTSYAGLTRAEELLAGSGLPHTVVRAVTLTDAPATGRDVDVTGQELRGNPTLARADLAAHLVDLAAAGGGARRVQVAATPSGGFRTRS